MSKSRTRGATRPAAWYPLIGGSQRNDALAGACWGAGYARKPVARGIAAGAEPSQRSTPSAFNSDRSAFKPSTSWFIRILYFLQRELTVSFFFERERAVSG